MNSNFLLRLGSTGISDGVVHLRSSPARWLHGYHLIIPWIYKNAVGAVATAQRLMARAIAGIKGRPKPPLPII